MTKEITKAFIIQQMSDKFGLRELVPERFSFSEMVIPTYEIEQHLKTYIADFEENGVTATGAITFFTVPENEMWHLQRYGVTFMGAGAYTVSGLYISRKNEVKAAAIYLDLTAAQTVSYIVDLPKSVILSPGDRLRVNVDGYTSPQDLRLYIDYTKEEIR